MRAKRLHGMRAPWRSRLSNSLQVKKTDFEAPPAIRNRCARRAHVSGATSELQDKSRRGRLPRPATALPAERARELFIPTNDRRYLVPRLVDEPREAIQVLARDLDLRGGYERTASQSRTPARRIDAPSPLSTYVRTLGTSRHSGTRTCSMLARASASHAPSILASRGGGTRVDRIAVEVKRRLDLASERESRGRVSGGARARSAARGAPL